MAKKRVFIASAGEDKDAAQVLASTLSETYEVVTWWGHTFTAGGFTIDQLIARAHTVDAAIVLFSALDSIEVRNVRGLAPRDNCLLEYGLFSAILGRARTIVVAGANVRIPSDLFGIIYERLADPVTTAGQVRILLDKIFKEHPVIAQSTPIVAEQRLAMYAMREGIPQDWRNRQLYFSHSGAAAWIDTSSDQDYLPKEQDNWLQEQIDNAVMQVDPLTLVSLGPGSGDVDSRLISALQLRDPWLRYVPVDISSPLLVRAVHKFKDRVLMPVAINADLESDWNFIHSHLASKAPRPYLFSLLGNTLGNVDTSEMDVLSAIVGKMQPSDTLLLDVALAGEKWSIEKDPRAKHDSYTPRFRKWLANGVSERLGQARETVVHDFDQIFSFKCGTRLAPKSRSIEVLANFDGASVKILTIRRYDLASLREWLTEKLRLSVVFNSHTYYSDGISGDAVFVLRRK